MLSKRFAILAVLAALPALAQVSNSPLALSADEVYAPVQHAAPMRLHRQPTTLGSVQSDNWSGYAVTGSAFTHAEGSWTQPSVNCTKTPNAYAAFWVGIDGYNSSTVEQTGTIGYCIGTAAHYYAWYEFYPQASVQITSIPVTPGNKFSATVTYIGSSRFTVKITDEATGKTFSKTGTVSAAKRTSAEWIAEAPSSITGILPLADFGVASFGDDYTGVTGTNDASDSTITGPISDFGTGVEEITMVSSGGTKEAVPGALTTDGSSFKVTWKSK